MLQFHSCAIAYLCIMSYIVIKILNETRPMWYYVLAASLFVLSQLAWFLLSRVICKVRRFHQFHHSSYLRHTLSLGLKCESRRFVFGDPPRNRSCWCAISRLEEYYRRYVGRILDRDQRLLHDRSVMGDPRSLFATKLCLIRTIAN